MKTPGNRVCLVTGELFPFTAGGIGRLTHNLIEDALHRDADVELHLLMPSWIELAETAVVSLYGGRVKFHKAEHLDSPASRKRWGAAYPPRWAFTDTPAHADSMELMLELKFLEQQGITFDVVEFPDYLGWAFCSIQERRLGNAFSGTNIAIRLHSTAGIIQAVEGVKPSITDLGTFELERRSLQEADLLVAHLAGVIDENARFYGFDDAWKSHIRVEFPPIGEATAAQPTLKQAKNCDLVFITKVQRCKRPDLFAKAAILYMRRHPEWTGNAVFACHVPDADLHARIRASIPADLDKRFLFAGPASREPLMRSGVVVIPSDYESLNLAAYEAAALGANLVLNERCVAFGKSSPFVNAVNCWTFDGSIDGLAQAIDHAVREGRPGPLEWKSTPAYFERKHSIVRRKPLVVGGSKVSVLVTNYNLGAYLSRCLESVAASTHENVEVVIVDDGSTNPVDRLVLDSIEKSANPRLKLVRNVVNRGLPASRNIGLRHCTGKFVVPLDADDLLAPHFLETAATALEANDEISAVVPTTGYFLTDGELDARRFCDFAVFQGNVPSLGLVANRLSSATAMIRRSVFDTFKYDEGLDSYEDWSLYLRMAHAGLRFLVTNEIAFFYRRREGSMVRTIDPHRRQRLMARMYASLPVAAAGLVHLEAITSLSNEAAAPAPAVTAASDLPLRYSFADRANAFIKRTPLVHQRVRRNLEPMSKSVERPLRYDIVDRLADVLSRFTRAS